MLRRDASASFSGGSGKGGARRRQLVAVKQLKPAVLENEIELHGFIAETSGELLGLGMKDMAHIQKGIIRVVLGTGRVNQL